MDKKNIIIACLALIILILAIMMWQDSNRNQSQEVQSDQDQTDQIDPTEAAGGRQDTLPNQPSDPAPVESGKSFEQQLSQTNWVLSLITLDGQTINMDVKVPKPLALEFNTTEKTYSGFGGCNGFGGDYVTESGAKFSFGQSVGTLMYCEETSPLEGKYSQAREKVANFAVKGKQLVFTSEDGKTTLVYNPSI